MGLADRVDQFEHDVVTDRTGDVAADVESARVRLIEVPARRHRLAVVVTDHLEERSADQFVDRAPGQHRGALVRGLDHATVVQSHDRVRQVVEEPSDLGLGARELSDRASEPSTDPSGLEHGGHDGDECERRDAADQADGLGAGIGTRSHPGQHHQRRGHRDDRQDQPPRPVLAFVRWQPCGDVVGVAAGDHRTNLERSCGQIGAFPNRRRSGSVRPSTM